MDLQAINHSVISEQ